METAKTKKSVFMVFLFSVVVFMFAVSSTAVAAKGSNEGGTTIQIYSSLGGTTEPSAGIANYSAGEVVVLKATPSSGYTFDHWIYVGPNIPHGLAEGSQSTYYENPLTITCGDGWNLEWQPVFVQSSLTALPSSTGIRPEHAVIAVSGVSSIVGAAAFLVGKRRK